MKTSLLLLVLLTLTAGFAEAASPSYKTGPYMSGFIGAGIVNDTSVASENYFTGGIFNDKVEFDPGIDVGATGGYNFGYFRLEGELSYKHSSMSDITDQYDYFRFHNVDGDVAALAMMCNGFVDLRNQSPITPYFGGGIGFATIYLSDTFATDTRWGLVTRNLIYAGDTAPVFAYQVGGGLELALNRVLSLDFGYRYFATTKAKFENSWDSRSELTFRSHNATVGLRVNF